ncbi:hypothetical protein KR009_011959, partial [Drosophila setifemur]
SSKSSRYCSYAGQEQCDNRDPLEEPSCEHWQFCEKISNPSDMGADSLGNAVGLVCSNTKLENPCGTSPMQQEANARNFAIYLKAFALVYILPEVDWTAEKIDMLLQEGTDLLKASSEMEADQRNDLQLLQGDIYTEEENRIKRVFNLEGHTFTLALEPSYMGDGSIEQQLPHTMINLRQVLNSFFKAGRYCLLLTRVGHLLIWRRRKAFFVLDVKGRRKDDLQTVKHNGVAMLVCLKSIDNVVHLTNNLSSITPQDKFTIRELVVVRLQTPDGRIYMRDTSNRSMEFKVVNKNYAYLKSNFHLSLKQNNSVRNRSGLMVAVAAILASKIDHPSNWNTNMLDQLICYGVELCRSCWSDCLRDRRPIDLDTFPTQLRVGQFVLELKLIPNVRTGHWKSGFHIIGTDFEAHVKQVLKEFGNAIFQINDQMYALWAKDEFYYLIDPYRHTIVGTHLEEDKAGGAKWTTVRMFRDQLTMLSVFHQLLKESNRQSAYYLHVVRIRNLAECPKGFALAPLPEDVDTSDVESLNETILFHEQQSVSVCDKSLGYISDYEKDLVSPIDDIFDNENLTPLTERQMAGAERNIEDKRKQEVQTKLTKPTRNHIRSSSRSASKKPQVVKKISPQGTIKAIKSSNISILHRQSDLRSKPVQKQGITSTKTFKKKAESPKKVVAFGGTVPLKPNPPKALKEMGGKMTNLVPGKSPFRSSSRESHGQVSYKLSTKEPATRGSRPKEVGTIGSPSKKAPSKELNPIRYPNKGPSPNISVPKRSSPRSVPPKFTNSLFVAPVDIEHLPTPAHSGEKSEHSRREQPWESAEEFSYSCGPDNPQEQGKADGRPRFPGFTPVPQLLAVAGSESGTVESLNRLLTSSFKVANRVLAMTPWGNYVVFRHRPSAQAATWFYIFDGCTCDIDRFRHLDLLQGTAGLLVFRKQSEVVCHMIDSREKKALKILNSVAEDPPHTKIEKLLAR